MRTDTNTRPHIPASLLDTYDATAEAFDIGRQPRRNIRLDMVTACVESFDWLVKAVANSPYCIADIVQIPHDGDCKRRCVRNCERCVRSHVYASLLHNKKEEFQV